MESSVNDEISINDILHVIVKRWKSIFLPSVLVAVLVYIVASLIPRSYEAFALLRVGTIGSQPLETIEATSEVMKRQLNASEIGRNFTAKGKLKIFGNLGDDLKYKNVGGLLEIRATANSAENANRIVNTAVQTVIVRHQTLFEEAQKRLDSTVKYLSDKTHTLTLLSNINELSVEPTTIVIPSTASQVKSNRCILAGISFMIVLIMSAFVMVSLEEGKRK